MFFGVVDPQSASYFNAPVILRECFEGNIYRSVPECCMRWRSQEFCSGGGSSNSVEDRGQRERGSGGGSPLVMGSGGSCNFVQEISFHIVKFS